MTLALAVTASAGFAGGYLFHLNFGQELPAARQALIQRDASQRVLDAYAEILQAQSIHTTLASTRSIEEMQGLKGRSRQAVLTAIERFSRIAGEAEDRRERLLAQAFLPEAAKIKAALDAEP